MALKAVHVSDIPNLIDQVSADNASLFTNSPRFSATASGSFNKKGGAVRKEGAQFMVIGHRGSGMNMLQSPDPRMKAIKENTLLSFNSAATIPNLHFIEFDVQYWRKTTSRLCLPKTAKVNNHLSVFVGKRRKKNRGQAAKKEKEQRIGTGRKTEYMRRKENQKQAHKWKKTVCAFCYN